jgi:hypothetical protein
MHEYGIDYFCLFFAFCFSQEEWKKITLNQRKVSKVEVELQLRVTETACFHAGFLFGLSVDLDYVCYMLLRNVNRLSKNYTALYHRRKLLNTTVAKEVYTVTNNCCSAVGLRAGRTWGRNSSPGSVKNFRFSISSRPVLRPSQPPL